MEIAAANGQVSKSACFFPLHLLNLNPDRMYNEPTHAVSHGLTIFQNITISVPLKSVQETI